MKQIISGVFLLMSFFGTAQDKKMDIDKIVKKDFTVIEGNVIKVTEKTIEFSYVNEKTINSLAINSVARIYFSSGRVQEFVAAAVDPEVQNITQSKQAIVFRDIKKNTIAVLPVSFLNSETHEFSEERSKYAQSDLYNEISKYSNQYISQDVRETNNLLNLAGIDYNLLDTTPIETLQAVLGVDTVVAGKVSYTVNKRQDVMTDSYSEVGTNKRRDSRVYETGFSNTSIQDDTMYDYKVYLDVYKNSQKIYSQTRVPLNVFGAGKDKWIDAMKYLIKRSPLYMKK